MPHHPPPSLLHRAYQRGARRSQAAVGMVMLWFMLSLGAAIASPFVHPQVVELVCTSIGSVKAVVHTDSGVEEQGMGRMDCPLCLLAAPPPSSPAVDLPAVLPLGHALQPIPSARIAAATTGPLPARGPPTLS